MAKGSSSALVSRADSSGKYCSTHCTSIRLGTWTSTSSMERTTPQKETTNQSCLRPCLFASNITTPRSSASIAFSSPKSVHIRGARYISTLTWSASMNALPRRKRSPASTSGSRQESLRPPKADRACVSYPSMPVVHPMPCTLCCLMTGFARRSFARNG
jgi:hypothetical protein